MLKAGSTSIRKTASFRCIPQYAPRLQQDPCPANLPLAHAAAMLPSFLVPAWAGLHGGGDQTQHIHTHTYRRVKEQHPEELQPINDETGRSPSDFSGRSGPQSVQSMSTRVRLFQRSRKEDSKLREGSASHNFKIEQRDPRKVGNRSCVLLNNRGNTVRRRKFSTSISRRQEVQPTAQSEAPTELSATASTFNDRFGTQTAWSTPPPSHTSTRAVPVEDEAWKASRPLAAQPDRRSFRKGKERQLKAPPTKESFQDVLRSTCAKIEQLAVPPAMLPTAQDGERNAISIEKLASVLTELLSTQNVDRYLHPTIALRKLRQPLAKMLNADLRKIDTLLASLNALKKDIDFVQKHASDSERVSMAVRDALLLNQISNTGQALVQLQANHASPTSEAAISLLERKSSSEIKEGDHTSSVADNHAVARKSVHTVLNRIATIYASPFPSYSLSMIPPLAFFLAQLSPRTAASSFRSITSILHKIEQVKSTLNAPIITAFSMLFVLLSNPVVTLSSKLPRSRSCNTSDTSKDVYSKFWQKVKRDSSLTAHDWSALFQAAERAGKLDMALDITKIMLRPQSPGGSQLQTAALSAKSMAARVSKALISEGRLNQAENLLKHVYASCKEWSKDTLLWQRRLEVTLARAMVSQDSKRVLQDMHSLLSELQDGSIRLDAYALSSLIHGLPNLDIPLKDAFQLLKLARTVPIDLSPTAVPSEETIWPSSAAITTVASDLRAEQHERMVNLAAVVCDFELHDKARRAHIQIPWEPLASSLLPVSASPVGLLDAPGAGAVGNVSNILHFKLDFSRAVLLHRLAIYKKDKDAALRAYESVLLCGRPPLFGHPLDSSTLAVLSELQQSALVRALSDALERQDLLGAIRTVELTMQSLGARSIGHEVLRRLLTAACSPHFHHAPDRRGINELYIDPALLLQVLAIIRKWAFEQTGGTGVPNDHRYDRLHEVHRLQYIRQIVASPSVKDRLIQASILGFLTPSKAGQPPSGSVSHRAAEGFQMVMYTMRELYALESKRWFWGRMQLHGEALDGWLHTEDLAKGAGWKHNEAVLREVIDTNWTTSRPKVASEQTVVHVIGVD